MQANQTDSRFGWIWHWNTKKLNLKNQSVWIYLPQLFQVAMASWQLDVSFIGWGQVAHALAAMSPLPFLRAFWEPTSLDSTSPLPFYCKLTRWVLPGTLKVHLLSSWPPCPLLWIERPCLRRRQLADTLKRSCWVGVVGICVWGAVQRDHPRQQVFISLLLAQINLDLPHYGRCVVLSDGFHRWTQVFPMQSSHIDCWHYWSGRLTIVQTAKHLTHAISL